MLNLKFKPFSEEQPEDESSIVILRARTSSGLSYPEFVFEDIGVVWEEIANDDGYPTGNSYVEEPDPDPEYTFEKVYVRDNGYPMTKDDFWMYQEDLLDILFGEKNV